MPLSPRRPNRSSHERFSPNTCKQGTAPTPMTEMINVECSDGVQTLTMARPEKKNALTVPMYRALADALNEGESDDAVRVRIISGAGGAFCAGNDIGDFLAQSEGGEQPTDGLDFLTALASGSKPLIAAVDGLAVGIGTTLLFHCDLVFASPEARFQTPFVDLGLVPEGASSLLVPRMVGHMRAFEMLCLGSPFSAERAFLSGFVNAVFPADELMEKSRQVALGLAAKPQDALLAARRLLRGDPDEVLTRLHDEGVVFAERLQSQEARAAFASFVGH